MSLDLFVNSARERVASREEIRDALRARGWEIRFLTDWFTFAPADEAEPIGNEDVVGWQSDWGNAAELRRLCAARDMKAIEAHFQAGHSLAGCALNVTAPDPYVLEEGGYTEEQLRRELGSAATDVLLARKSHYYLRTSGGRSVESVWLQYDLWHALGEVTGGLMEDPQSGEGGFAHEIPPFDIQEFLRGPDEETEGGGSAPEVPASPDGGGERPEALSDAAGFVRFQSRFATVGAGVLLVLRARHGVAVPDALFLVFGVLAGLFALLSRGLYDGRRWAWRVAPALALALCAAGCGGSGAPDAPNRTDLAGAVARTCVQYGVPAMAAAAIRLNSVDTAVAGVRRAGAPDLVTPADRFHLGSNTKAVTATIIAGLVEDGLLAWSTRPGEVFADAANGIHPSYGGITLEQLLVHRAGVPAYVTPEDLAGVPKFAGAPKEQRRAFSLWLLEQAPDVAVGTYQYSNAGYVIAAAMAEQVAGQSWEALLQARIFRPLGISGVVGWPAATDAHQPWGHFPVGNVYQPHDPHNAEEALPPAAAPAGDLSLSIGDYARFLQEHLRGLRGADGLVRAQTFGKMHTPVGEYAMGWDIVLDEGDAHSVHSGSAGTFLALAHIAPSRGLAVAVVANAADENANAAIADLWQQILEMHAGAGRSSGKVLSVPLR